MSVPFDTTAVSSLAQSIEGRAGPLRLVSGAQMRLWLPALSIPPAWTVAVADGAAVTRVLLRPSVGDAHWDGCEVVNLYRVSGSVPRRLVLDNADRTLRDGHAADITVSVLDVPAHYGIIATRASGLLRSGNRLVHSHFHNYVINTAAGGAFVEQALVCGADVPAEVTEEVGELTEGLYRSLLASIDRPHDPRL
jgi:hypothetical protein